MCRDSFTWTCDKEGEEGRKEEEAEEEDGEEEVVEGYIAVKIVDGVIGTGRGFGRDGEGGRALLWLCGYIFFIIMPSA